MIRIYVHEELVAKIDDNGELDEIDNLIKFLEILKRHGVRFSTTGPSKQGKPQGEGRE